MKFIVFAISLLMVAASGLPATAGDDAGCLAKLEGSAGRARRTVAVYTAELQGMSKESPYAAGAASICDGALGRADRYYAKETEEKAVCTTMSDYVDNQAVHLYNRAISTCRDEFETELRRLPDEAQADTNTRVAQKLAAIR